MPLFFVTGISGSGKTRVWQELKRRGYEAYDTDEDGLARWQNNDTGYIHPKSSVKQADRTAAFLQAHSWNVPRQAIEKMATEAGDRPVFLCGVATNEGDLRDLFKAAFALTIDDETLKHRLATRTNNEWGKQPHELQQTLERQHVANKTYQSLDYVIIDATQPLMSVVDEILQDVAAE